MSSIVNLIARIHPCTSKCVLQIFVLNLGKGINLINQESMPHQTGIVSPSTYDGNIESTFQWVTSRGPKYHAFKDDADRGWHF